MKSLSLDEDMAAALELGARFCNTLAAVEHAYMLEDEADFGNVLGGLDPTEIRMTANVLQALWMTWRVLPDVGSEPQGASVSPLHATPSAGPSSDKRQPSEPTLYSVRVD